MTTLPPYDPSASGLPPVTRMMSGDELCRRYKLSKSQFHNRKNAFPGIRGVVQGRSKVFTLSEIHILDSCHWYLNNGYTLKQVEDAYLSFQSDAPDVVLDVDLSDSDVQEIEPQLTVNKVPSQTVTTFTNTMERVASTLETINTGQKFLKDPLRTLRSLQEASDEAWEVSSKILASILEMAPATVHAWKTDQMRSGFLLKKIGPGKWRVIREDDGRHQRRVQEQDQSGNTGGRAA